MTRTMASHRSFMRRSLAVVTAVVMLYSGTNNANAALVDAHIDAIPTNEAVALTNALAPQHATIDLSAELIDSGAGRLPIIIFLRQAGIDQRRQALAHAIGCWWVPTRQDGTLLTSKRMLPVLDRITTEVYTSSLINTYDYEQLVLTIMEPHIDAERGIAYHPSTGRWSATLDNAGHSMLVQLLSLLERPKPSIPAIMPSPRLPPADKILPIEKHVSDWSQLAHTLADATNLCVSVAATAPAFPQPFAMSPATLEQTLTFLNSHGISASIIDGVICLDYAQPTVHPALGTHLTMLPVASLGSPERVQAWMHHVQTQVQPAWWRLPGMTIFHIIDDNYVLATTNQHVCRDVLQSLERWEHETQQAGAHP